MVTMYGDIIFGPKMAKYIDPVTKIKRIYCRSPMQTEKSQPEGKRIMPETRFTEYPALSVDPRVGISRISGYIR